VNIYLNYGGKMAVTSTALYNARQKAETGANNMAIAPGFGTKGDEVTFSTHYVGGKVGYVDAKTRQTLDQQGDVVGTGVPTDFFVQSKNGMAVVSSNPTQGGTPLYTRSTSFREEKKGFYVNSDGNYLMAWKLDDKGNLPSNSSLASSLTPVNLRNVSASAQATTSVTVAGNLQADVSAIKGGGEILSLSKSGYNANTLLVDDPRSGNDIIIPEDLASGGGIRQGDRFTMITQPDNQQRTYEFGGIAVGINIGNITGGLYGARSAGATFNVSNAGLPGAIAPGTGLTITIPGSNPYNFVATAASPDASLGQFNSLSTLVSAINATGELKARLDSDNRIYITQRTNPQNAITFASFGGSQMKELLGLSDVQAMGAGVDKRFNSMASLRRQINAEQSTTGLTAVVEGSSLAVRAALATSSFTISGSTNRVNSFQNATIGATAANDPTRARLAEFMITSPNHGLQNGDYVQIAATTDGRFAPGRYIVEKATADTFTIYPVNPQIGGGGGQFALAAAPTLDSGTWQKIAGSALATNPVRAADTVNNVVDAVGNITLTTAVAFANTDYAVGDLIYVSGIGIVQNGAAGNDISVPDGYYAITATPGGNQITFVAAANAAVHVAAPQMNMAGIRVQKVASTNAKDVRVMTTTGGANSSKVKLFMSNNGFKVGDYLSLEGLAAATAFDGVIVNNNISYKITATDPNFVIFELPAGAGVVGRGDEGATNGTDILTYAGGFNIPGTGPGNTGTVGANFRVNQYAKAFNGVGMASDPLDLARGATYSGADATKSLFSGNNVTSANRSVEVYDSLGVKHDLLIKFARLEDKHWAVEIGGVIDPTTNEISDIAPASLRADGVIVGATGEIFFKEDGSIQRVDGGIQNAIQISWADGAAASNIKIEWGEAAGGLDNSDSSIVAGIRQQNGKSILSSESNGYASGGLLAIEIDTSGNILGSFTNGVTKPLFRIPIAVFTNINGLSPSESGTYLPTDLSGAADLQEAGDDSVGFIISKALEGSNVDVTEQMLNVQDAQNHSQLNARMLSIENDIFKTMLAETK
jgi:flagellar hook-basal body protein